MIGDRPVNSIEPVGKPYFNCWLKVLVSEMHYKWLG